MLSLPKWLYKINLKFNQTFSSAFSNAKQQSIKMRNLKKLLPLFAFVLGLGLVFTQSAFKAPEQTDIYVETQDGYRLKSTQSGFCSVEALNHCEYLFTGTDPENPADYTPVADPSNDNTAWIAIP